MAQKVRIHHALAALMEIPVVGIILARGTAAPTAAATGYAPGCLFINTSGSAGTVLYVNTGTKASATWLNIA